SHPAFTGISRAYLGARGRAPRGRRAALVALGAEGDDLTDTERLLAVDDEDADEAQIHAAAGKACTTSAVSAATRTA
ncbi:hypothetical protein, partial [Streptomyces rubiginosohelvolus]